MSNKNISSDITTFTSADLIVHYLNKMGVEFIFGIPGGAIEPLYDALARSTRSGGVRSIVTRHETSAGFAADGYAQQTGKLGVCCATTGPGSTNLITSVSNAYANHIPLLVITAQTALPTFGRGAFQESSDSGVNIVGMFQFCTRYNSLVSHVEQIEHKLITAIMTAMQSPRGPVHLALPYDILRSKVSPSLQHVDINKLLFQNVICDQLSLKELYSYFMAKHKFCFVLGGGCGESVGPIVELAGLLNASIVTTPHGKGIISANHPRYRGVIGFAGHDSARTALNEDNADIVIAIETNLGEWASNGWNQDYLLNKRLVHIDSVAENLTRSPMAKLHVCGNILAIFEQLIEFVTSNKLDIAAQDLPVASGTTPEMACDKFILAPEEQENMFSDAVPIKPQRLMHELNQRFPDSTRFFADTGNSAAWAIHYLQPVDRRSVTRRGVNAGLFRNSVEFSSMGWAIGAAIGAAVGYRDGPIVCITGDGSFMMHGQELSVAVDENLSIIFVILNDGALGMVKHGQRLNNAEPIAFELPVTDFSAIAKAMGADGYIIESPDDMVVLDFQRLLIKPRPVVLDVRIDGEEVPPIGVRMQGLRAYQAA
ncbi:MAG: thiamine pyrophosphate-binding protein [Ectothiorhodospiraceae bacterium]|nr:thiamine pyrophosphate-binding protein [Ectothiorhodospiraceae bacterium]